MKQFLRFYLMLLPTTVVCLSMLVACRPSSGQASGYNTATTTNNGRTTPTMPHIHRYEVDFMKLDTNHLDTDFARLQNAYPIFTEGMNIADTAVQNSIRAFISDVRGQDILADIQQKYPNFDAFERSLFDGLARYITMFRKEQPMPEVYTYLSYLDYEHRVVFQDSLLMIAIDMYLGADYKHYTDVAIPIYISARLDAPYIVPDAMRSIAHYELGQQTLQTMLDHLILYGKIVYFLSQTLPNIDEWLYFGYTKAQWQWCKKNEAMMWAYLAKEKLFFTEDHFVIRKFVGESPTVSAFPASPGRVGWFIGYQIVKRYMEKSNQTLYDLFQLNDSQTVLSRSGYRP
jgi:hypothetical protein